MESRTWNSENQTSNYNRRGFLLPASCFLLPACFPALTGCESLFRKPEFQTAADVRGVARGVATPAALVDYLNASAEQVRSLDCQALGVEIKGVAHTKGYLTCRQPRDFRFVAETIRGVEADVGSNDQVFWFYVREGNPDGRVYYCRHEDLARGAARLPFPFAPEYIAQALGMARFGDAGNYRIADKGSTVDLIEDATQPDGRPVRKITTFAAGYKQYPPKPQVLEHRLETSQGRLIVSAKINRVAAIPGAPDQTYPLTYPTDVTLSCPDEKLELRLTLRDVHVNEPLNANREAAVFDFNTSQRGRRPVDLTTYDTRRLSSRPLR